MLKSVVSVTLILYLGQVVWGDSCNCPPMYNPVCGSDDKTYGNVCELNCAIVRSLSPLKIQSQGACPPPGADLLGAKGQQNVERMQYPHQNQDDYGSTKNTYNPQPVKQYQSTKNTRPQPKPIHDYQPAKNTYRPQPVNDYQPTKNTYRPQRINEYQPVKNTYAPQPVKTTYRNENVKQAYTATKGGGSDRYVEPNYSAPPAKSPHAYHSVTTTHRKSTYVEEEEGDWEPRKTTYAPARNRFHQPAKTTQREENVKQFHSATKGGGQPERIVDYNTQYSKGGYHPQPVKQSPAKGIQHSGDVKNSYSHSTNYEATRYNGPPQPNEPDADWVPSFGGF